VPFGATLVVWVFGLLGWLPIVRQDREAVIVDGVDDGVSTWLTILVRLEDGPIEHPKLE
jgi:hypothetical protein